MAASATLQVVVSPFIGLLFDNLSTLIYKEVGEIWGVDKEMKKLASTLSTIRHVLEDAEEKQIMDKALGNWLLKLRDLAYDADDILDCWATEGAQLQARTKEVCVSCISCFSFEHIMFRHRIAKRVNDLERKFSEVALEKFKFHLRGGGAERRLEHYRNRETSSLPNDPHVYGRDEEKEYIVGLLLNNVNNQEVLSVCPIVGIGGLGKTTVAQLCYNDQRVKEHFDVRIWVCVSDDFDVKRLTKAILASVLGDLCNIEELDPLVRRLQEKLAQRRFLLVLDDVWNEDQEEWSQFKNSMICGAIGSSVIITTRLKTVASITGTCSPCYLSSLSNDDCWSLFKQRAFGLGNAGTPKLVEIGAEIVKKCGGVPLAAKVLGGLMRFKHEEKEWLFVRNSRLWDLPQSSGNTILPALRLSYTHLDPHLRQCFAYCCIFAKDQRMEKEKLIRLWMANGLVKPKEGMQLEDVGNMIFNELSWRSFFQDEEKNSDGFVISCKMHDLLHDLACSINNNECCHLDGGNQIKNISKGTRHLSLSMKTITSSVVRSIHQSEAKLRSLILFSHLTKIEVPSSLHLSSFKSLQALSLISKEITTLDSISILKHLRYLNLSRNGFAFLPESICELCNLQTLELKDCSNLRWLPRVMSVMSSLRHLNINGCNNLRQMPTKMGKLTSLQTLSFFIVETDDGRRIKELQGLDGLSGDLMIKGLERVKSVEEAREANLMGKKNLLSLTLRWLDSNVEGENHRDVMEGLQPHSNVKMLSVYCYRGVTIPSWLEAPLLPNLVCIFLFSCRCEHLPASLGKLPLLKRVSMSKLDYVKFFMSDHMANKFPSLEYLSIDCMCELEDWISHIGNPEVILFPCLKELYIDDCPKLKSLPPSLLSLLETLRVSNCNHMILGSLEKLNSLSSLEISSFTETSCFPEECLQNLPSLKSIRITDCPALQSLPEVGGSSLTQMRLRFCPSLTSVYLGLRYQTALQSLTYLNCPKVETSTVEYHHLNSLRKIKFIGCNDLTCLPDGLQHISSTLRHLHVKSCSSLTSVPDWIGGFTHLESLYLDKCENLKSLPHGLQTVTNLQFLCIQQCHPELHDRCKKEIGEDWLKVAHIPYFENFPPW